jgi:hypothetical protein
MSKWETIGYIGVDSGTVMVGDPCYVVPDEIWSDWCHEFDRNGGHDNRMAEMDDGYLAITTPHGDGSYPVKARRNNRGQIVELRIQLGWDDE